MRSTIRRAERERSAVHGQLRGDRPRRRHRDRLADDQRQRRHADGFGEPRRFSSTTTRLPAAMPGGIGDVTPDTANTTGTLAHTYGADGAGSTLLTGAGLPTSSATEGAFIQAVTNGGQTLTISQIQNGVAVAVLQVAAQQHHGRQLHGDAAACRSTIRRSSNENNLSFTVNYTVHRPRRRHRDRLADDQRQRRHADGCRRTWRFSLTTTRWRAAMPAALATSLRTRRTRPVRWRTAMARTARARRC